MARTKRLPKGKAPAVRKLPIETPPRPGGYLTRSRFAAVMGYPVPPGPGPILKGPKRRTGRPKVVRTPEQLAEFRANQKINRKISARLTRYNRKKSRKMSRAGMIPQIGCYNTYHRATREGRKAHQSAKTSAIYRAALNKRCYPHYYFNPKGRRNGKYTTWTKEGHRQNDLKRGKWLGDWPTLGRMKAADHKYS